MGTRGDSLMIHILTAELAITWRDLIWLVVIAVVLEIADKFR
jgi:hypothetical protein